MRRSGILLGLLLAATVSAPSFADDGAAPAWETLRVEAGIQVARRVVPGSDFVAFRGEGDIDAPLLAVADVLVDVPHDNEWMDSVREARILRKVSDTEYILYSHVGTPPPLTDREFVTDVHVSIDPAGDGLRVDMRSVDDPLAPSTGYVRANLTGSTFTLRANPDHRTTHVVAEVHCDPRGMIPAWVMNSFQKSWGYKTLQSLRRQVARGDAPVNPLLKDRIAGN
jgi:hypothetical protein